MTTYFTTYEIALDFVDNNIENLDWFDINEEDGKYKLEWEWKAE